MVGLALAIAAAMLIRLVTLYRALAAPSMRAFRTGRVGVEEVWAIGAVTLGKCQLPIPHGRVLFEWMAYAKPQANPGLQFAGVRRWVVFDFVFGQRIVERTGITLR